MDARKARSLQLIGLAVIIAAGLGLLAWQFDLGALMAWCGVAVTRCIALVRDAGPLVFFGAMAVLPLFGFPLAPFIFSAGPAFGPTLGIGTTIACGVAAVAINVSIGYWLASRALRPLLERIITRLGYSVPQLPPGKNWELTLLLRVVPGVPHFMQNYLLGLARVDFGSYLLISVLTTSGYLVAAALAGDAIVHKDKRMLIVAGVAFVIVGFVLNRLRKRLLAAKRARMAAEKAL